jgi:uncharacterized protein YjbI with pentapeptide repeats
MTNYNKSFNFRNGVQVDDTNFIINANGLVGIGTSIPREVLDVHGNAKITGFITATTIYSSRLEVETTTNTLLNVGVVSITSAGIITASSSGGIVTYYGDGGNLLNLPTSQWVDVDPGFGYTSIYAAGNVGIATTYPNYTFQVGGNVGADQSGVGINSLGSIIATGIITASKFVGIGSDLTLLDASNIGQGTLNNSRLPSNINVSGIVTGYSFSGFGTNISGINASNISNGTLNNSRLPSNINVSGIVTGYSFSGFGTNLTGINASNIGQGTLNNSRLPSNINVSGIVTGYSFSGFGTNLTGINASNISNGTLNNSRLPSNINVSGIVTASKFVGTDFVGTSFTGSTFVGTSFTGSTFDGTAFTGSTFVGTSFTGSTFTGDLIGTATTASSLSGTPNIEVGTVTASNVTASNLSASGIVTASEFNLGIGGTIVNITSDGRVAIGSDTPTRPFEIITTGTSEIELVGSEARIILAQEKSGVGIADSAGVIRYGNSNNAFELVNYAPGDFNFYLHAGGPGINTGRFAWVYGQDFSEKMSLTYDGSLGIGITNPSNTLHVVGTSTVTGNSFIGGDLTVSGNINGSITIADILTSNINVTSGISTFNIINPTQFGIGTNAPIVDVDARSSVALFSSVGIGTDDIGQADLRVPNGFAEFTSVGIGTTQVYTVPDDGNSGDLQLHNKSMTVFNGSVLVDDSPISSIGFGTFIPRSILDFGRVGAAASTGFMILPTLDSTQRVGLAYTVEGAIIYNSTTKKHQGYGSIDGGTTFGWQDLY